MRLVLASASPRRKELLTGLGLPFDIVPSLAEEDATDKTRPGEAAAVALKLARRKAADVVARLVEEGPQPAETLVVAADTLVVLPDRVLGKPADAAEAVDMLSALAGREHSVVTGVVVAQPSSGRVEGATEETRVFFRPLTAGQIQAYVATGEPLDKAGSYAIQGVGSLLVESLVGDYFNVVGLPLACLGRLMERFGVDLLEEAAQAGRRGTRRDLSGKAQ